MTQKTEILIIGGGAIGLCSAFYLNAAGKQVTLVEGHDIGAGSSYGNAGLVVPTSCVPLAAPGVISKGLKWMFNPESPFYIKPRMQIDFLRWLWRFARACRPQQAYGAIALLRELQVNSMRLFDEMTVLEGLDFGLEKKGALMRLKLLKPLRRGFVPLSACGLMG